MSIPEALQITWAEATSLTETGEPEKALELLRSVAWDACENGAQKARTLRFAADAGTALGEQDTANQKRHWQRAHKNYRKALNFDPKDKETRRRMNKLASMMDEQAVSLGVGLQIFDEGNPTPLGLVTFLVAFMLVLVSFKVIPELFDTPEDNPVVILEISYMPSGSNERVTALVEIELYPDEAPLHVENFLLLTEEFRYDFTEFHRIIDDFMIQGGDPNTKNPDKSIWGQGGPGHNLKAEFSSRSHLRGIVSMARSTDPDSAGSQFFIVTSDSTFLDKQYTVFGEVVDGMEVADKIVNLPRDGNDCPKQEAKMLEVAISE